MTEEKEKKAKMDWLDQHDSIQLDLLKMKEDIVRESPVSKPDRNTEYPKKDQSNEQSLKDLVNGIPTKRPENNLNDSNEMSQKEKEIRTIPNSIPFGKGFESKEKEEATRLPVGKIPTSPDLTMKIANVIQLENKLKRRKYEMEKKERLSREDENQKKEMAEKKESSLEQNSKDNMGPENVLSMVNPTPPVSPVDSSKTHTNSNDRVMKEHGIKIEESVQPNQSIQRSDGPDLPDDPHRNGPPHISVRRRMIIRRKGTINNGTVDRHDENDKDISRKDETKQNIEISPPPTNEGSVRSGGPFKSLTKFFRRGNEEK